jgi:hypothetical protein
MSWDGQFFDPIPMRGRQLVTFAVPELTRSGGIKLNKRLSLRHRAMRLTKLEGRAIGGPKPVTTKKHPKQKALIRARRLTTENTELVRLYEEVLRLRAAVRRAESRTKRAKAGFGPH